MDFGELRNLKDFLKLFNSLSQECFNRCVFDLGQATTNNEEINCIETCISKNVNVNQKFMSLYVDINPVFQENKLKQQQEELEKIQAEALKKLQGEQPQPAQTTQQTPAINTQPNIEIQSDKNTNTATISASNSSETL